MSTFFCRCLRALVFKPSAGSFERHSPILANHVTSWEMMEIKTMMEDDEDKDKYGEHYNKQTMLKHDCKSFTRWRYDENDEINEAW